MSSASTTMTIRLDPQLKAKLGRLAEGTRRSRSFLAAEAVMRLYAAGDSLPARLLRDGALRLGNLPPLRRALTARMRDPDPGSGPFG